MECGFQLGKTRWLRLESDPRMRTPSLLATLAVTHLLAALADDAYHINLLLDDRPLALHLPAAAAGLDLPSSRALVRWTCCSVGLSPTNCDAIVDVVEDKHHELLADRLSQPTPPLPPPLPPSPPPPLSPESPLTVIWLLTPQGPGPVLQRREWLEHLLERSSGEGVALRHVETTTYDGPIWDGAIIVYSAYSCEPPKVPLLPYLERFDRRGYAYGLVHVGDEQDGGCRVHYQMAVFVIRTDPHSSVVRQQRECFEDGGGKLTKKVGDGAGAGPGPGACTGVREDGSKLEGGHSGRGGGTRITSVPTAYMTGRRWKGAGAEEGGAVERDTEHHDKTWAEAGDERRQKNQRGAERERQAEQWVKRKVVTSRGEDGAENVEDKDTAMALVRSSSRRFVYSFVGDARKGDRQEAIEAFASIRPSFVRAFQDSIFRHAFNGGACGGAAKTCNPDDISADGGAADRGARGRDGGDGGRGRTMFSDGILERTGGHRMLGTDRRPAVSPFLGGAEYTAVLGESTFVLCPVGNTWPSAFEHALSACRRTQGNDTMASRERPFITADGTRWICPDRVVTHAFYPVRIPFEDRIIPDSITLNLSTCSTNIMPIPVHVPAFCS